MVPGVLDPKRHAPNMTPDYEVKLQLNPSQVLNSEHEVLSTILQNFKMPTTFTKMNIQFLDTCSKEIYAAGWSLRIRRVENKPDLELNYKKRYDVEKGDITAALTQANNDGFDAEDNDYEAQIEWGYAKQTLSISRDKDAPYTGNSEMDLMGTIDSRKLLIKKAPGKFDNWGPGDKWGSNLLLTAGIYGPILAKRWVGTWKSIKKIYIEVWPILTSEGTGVDYIVEASFKTDDYTTALTERNNLTEDLQMKGWLLPQDILKTKLIMERYACPRVLGGMGGIER